jgi:hypothetical protein
MIMWGARATSDELTGNFGSALKDTSIGDCRLVALFAKKSLQPFWSFATQSVQQRTLKLASAGCAVNERTSGARYPV